MIKQLTLQNFTVFKNADLHFSSGLNVIVGENGTGKTHLLKLTYLFSQARYRCDLIKNKSSNLEAKVHQDYFSERLQELFKCDSIGSLVSADSDGQSKISASITINIKTPHEPESPSLSDEIKWNCWFSHIGINTVMLDRSNDNVSREKSVYLPSKEMISFFEGFLAAYENREFQFDETYRDLALNLSNNKLKNPPKFIEQDLKLISDNIEGKLKLEGGRFYLVFPNHDRREVTLVAEGIRKIATLLYLLENGSLEVGDTLLWDEPESNLNPKLIKDVAAALYVLSENGIQIILTTHSYFLLKEIDLISRLKGNNVETTYFGLSKLDNDIRIEQGKKLQDISSIVALDEELTQYDREQSLYYGN
jgi:AAA15 family ATPase/GTPase